MRAIARLIAAVAALALIASAQQLEPTSEQEMVRLVNQARASAGLQPLAIDDGLTQVARQHSELMSQKNALAHQFGGEPGVRQRIATTTLRFNYSGENVALDADAQRAHTGLMNSPPHRANILKPEFNAIGIGVVRKGTIIYVTEDFARRLPEVSIDQAEQTITVAFNRLRESAGAEPLPRRPAPELRQAACNMAADDHLSARSVQNIAGVRNVVVYTASELEKLPASAQQLKSEKSSGFSVGVCSAKSASYPNAVYWVALVTYF